ncbi:MAG: 50S ribosome-binding GTPase [Clostridiales bacterium]|jgi:ferrous iron transport protein B|nr:50S ribosome-binding GTPase [Clostridiales bacterium]
MGLTCQSSGKGVLREDFLSYETKSDYIVALAGNPNTGKSTVFNALTGLKQHTGNWPGKTVTQALGNYRHGQKLITLVDLPGTYSLLANSPEEQVARDFICFAEPDATVVVVDSTCLERNLNLVLQVLEITPKTIVCLNLIDEARRKKLRIDVEMLAIKLGVPVIPTAARSKEGLGFLKDTINRVASDAIQLNPLRLKYEDRLEVAISKLAGELEPLLPERINKRWIALRLLDGDYTVIDGIQKFLEKKIVVEGFAS